MPDKKPTEGTTPIDYEGTLKSLTESYYNALDSINRLQAKLDEAEDTIQFADKELKKANTEIERLEKDSKRLKKVEMQLDDAMKMYDTIKAEAYKEFAEKVKQGFFSNSEQDVLICGVVDNILKEMAGDNNV